MTSIKIRNLKARYKKNSSETILNIPKFDLDKGEIVGFFGPNHVGKSTLLRVIAQLHENMQYSGSILFEGKIYNKNANTPLLLYVPQDYNSTIYPWYSIKENLRILMKSLSIENENIEEIISDFCTEFGYKDEFSLLKDFGYITKGAIRKVTELSGGQVQILTVLRTIMSNPDIISMDEPFSALDIYKGTKFRKRVFAFLRKKKITTLIVGHELEELIALTDKIFFFNYSSSGEILQGIENSDVTPENVENKADELKTKYQLI